MLNVTLASHSPHVAGAENMVVTLASDLMGSNELSPTVLVPNPDDGPLSRVLTARGVRWKAAPALRWYLYETPATQHDYAQHVLGTAEQYAELYHSTNTDIVVVNTLVNVECALGAHLAGLPYLLWVHGVVAPGTDDIDDPFKSAMDRLILQNAASVVCCSHWTERHFQTHRLQNLQTIQNWTAPVPASSAVRSDRLCVVTSLVPHKDTETAVRAIARLKQSGLSVGLDVYGEGPLRSHLEDLIVSLGVSDLVILHGRTETPTECYHRALAVIVPSIVESFGLVALEAMAAGTPVIVSAAGGLVEIVEDNISGLHFETSNSDDLAEKIAILVGSPDLRNALAQGGLERASTAFSNARARADMERALLSAHQRFTGHEEGAFDLLRILANVRLAGRESLPLLHPMAEELASIKASTYWRAGAPLRSIFNGLPAVRSLIRKSLGLSKALSKAPANRSATRPKPSSARRADNHGSSSSRNPSRAQT
jgi:glycosyltransferase involved in cell wall biosynthesis